MRLSVLTMVMGATLACGGVPGAGPPTTPEAPGLVVVERKDLGPAPDAVSGLQVAPTLDSVAWVEARPDGEYVLRDGEVLGGPYERLAHPPRFDPTGRVVAWEGFSGGAWQVRVGDRQMGPYAGVGEAGVGFTPDGSHWGFHVRTADGWVVVVDGAPSAAYEQSSTALLGPAGHYAWLAGVDGRAQVVVDGAVKGTWDEALLQAFSPDGSRFAWAARAADGWRVIVDGVEQPGAWDEVGHVALSPDGADAVWLGARAGQWYVADATGERGPYADATLPAFAPDGRLAYGYEEQGRWRLRVGDDVSPPQDGIGDGMPVFGVQTFAWWSGRDGRNVVWRGLEEFAVVEAVAETGVDLVGPNDTPAFLARDAQGWFARVGDWESPRYAAMSDLVVADDLRHVAFAARGADPGSWAVHVVDRVEGTTRSMPGDTADLAGGGIAFVEPGRVRFTVVSGGRIATVLAERSGQPR